MDSWLGEAMAMLRKLVERLWRATELLMAIAMVVMIILVFINVVLRYGFDSGILASAEISRFLFVWVIMIGAVICMRDDAHLDLRVIEHRLPGKIRWVLRRLVYAVIILTSGMLFLGSARQTIANWSNISPMSGIPVGAMYLAGAVAGALIAAIAILRFLVPQHNKVSGREEQE